ncbi:unnamed protein product [Peronospora belbahrii]|uniref:Uncharacterized protein n=1 Tax=Peronospora belbahrii TaxID=622444 RepID=A0ABN8CVK6_9STRA|nr:unnamed protein product [Peronospora belbahrii]
MLSAETMLLAAKNIDACALMYIRVWQTLACSKMIFATWKTLLIASTTKRDSASSLYSPASELSVRNSDRASRKCSCKCSLDGAESLQPHQ